MRFLSNILAKAALIVDGTALFNNTANGVTPPLADSSTKFATTEWVKNQGYSSSTNTTVRIVESFVALQGQTVFTISSGYTPGLLDVYYNGSHLSESEYTATDGLTLTLSSGVYESGDVIDVVAGVPYVNIPVMPGGTNSNVLIDCGTITAPNENVLIDCGAI
jgi:hypothetical protein